MRWLRYDPQTGDPLEWGEAGEEHLEAAHARGEALIVLRVDDPYVFDGKIVDVASGSLRLIDKEPA